jgi:acetyl esterase/lipase
MVFVHGGGFVRGDKDQGGGLFANVLHEFAATGWLEINVEYRLASNSTLRLMPELENTGLDIARTTG